MSRQQQMSDVRIKIEENNGLQSYLDNFNKDILNNDEEQNETISILQETGNEDEEMDGNNNNNDDDDDEDGGTYFVDQTGNYYYQANKNSEPILTTPPSHLEEYIADEDEGEAEEAEKNSIEPENNVKLKDISKNSNSANGSQSTVNHENNSEEISYVLVMENDPLDLDDTIPDESVNLNDSNEIDEDQQLEDAPGSLRSIINNNIQKVYEFDGDENSNFTIKAEEEDDNKTGIKIITKKPLVNQVHMCNYCTYTSTKRYLLSRHMKSHSEERPYKCSVCERGFKNLASLQNHVNTHTGTKPHRCKFCESSFTTSGELVRHVRYRHTFEKPHKCNECDYASVELSKLKRHIRCHTGERPYQCPHCTYASPDTFKLKRHLRIHTGEKPYECDVCHARFTQSNSLKAHKLIHSVGEKPVFHCELCPTTCGRKTDLRIHVQKLHTSDKPLQCKRCGKSYPDRYSYKLHSKTHEGEKCFKCDLCPYASISARHLESHLLIHTDQKPFQCTHCDQSFRQKQLLKRHINLYHDPNYVPPPPKEKTHACPSCTRSFRHKGNLIRHMALHDPDSGIREVTIALKMGRQKRVQIIDGQQVEVYDDGDEEEEEEEDEEEDDDNKDNGIVSILQQQQQQFENTEQQQQEQQQLGNSEQQQHQQQDEEDGMALMKQSDEADDFLAVEGDDGQRYVVLEVIQIDDDDQDQHQLQPQQFNDLSVEDFIVPSDLNDDVLHTLRTSRKLTENHTIEKDMSNCFGFGDDDDDELDETNHKSTIQLLEFNED